MCAMCRLGFRNLSALLLLLLCPAALQAQTPPHIPPTLEAARLQQNQARLPQPLSQPAKSVPLPLDQSSAAPAADITFVFARFNYRGHQQIEVADMEALWPFEPGQTVSVQDVFVYANAITALYAERGYALSFAILPEQDIKDGVVAIHIAEGFIENIHFSGDLATEIAAESVNRPARAITAKLLGSQPLTSRDLERYVLLANDLPGLNLATVIRASDSTPAASVLHVEYRDWQKWGGAVEYNNSMPAALGRHLMGVSLYANGLLSGSDRATLYGYRTVSDAAYTSVSADYVIGMGSEGLHLGLAGFYSNSKPTEDFLAALDYQGTSIRTDAYISYPMIRARSQNLSVQLTASLSDSEAELLSDSLTRDRLRSIKGELTYDFADRSGAITYLRLGLKHGLDILDASANSRANGRIQNTLALVNMQRNQPLVTLLQGGLALRMAAFGQASLGSGGLFSNDECAFGGISFGRGYDSGIATGEHCVFASAALHWQRLLTGGQTSIGLHGFIDGGNIRQKGALLAAERRNTSLMSAGGGIEIRINNNLTASVAVGLPIYQSWKMDEKDNYRLRTRLRLQF